MVYKVSAIAASAGVISLAIVAVYLRFYWHMEAGREFPWVEAAATLLLTIGGAVGLGRPCNPVLAVPVPIFHILGVSAAGGGDLYRI
jgi:hypothetical protein